MNKKNCSTEQLFPSLRAVEGLSYKSFLETLTSFVKTVLAVVVVVVVVIAVIVRVVVVGVVTWY